MISLLKSSFIFPWTGPSDKVLASEERAKTYIEESEFTVAGLFPDTEKAEAKTCSEAAPDDYPLSILVNTADIAKYKPGIGFLKGFNKGRNDSDGENINRIFNGNSSRLVVELNQDTAEKVFSGDIKSHFTPVYLYYIWKLRK